MALCVPLPSSDIVVFPPKSYITLLEYPIVLDFNRLMENKWAWEKDDMKIGG
jgi:hypothetical protein